MPAVSEKSVVVEVEIARPLARVFEALIRPEELVAWWSEGGAQRKVTWEFEPRAGGRWRSTGSDDSCGDYVMDGEITIYDPPRALAYTWAERSERGHGSGGTTLVRYDLSETPTGTRVRVTHSGFSDAAIADTYRNGWPSVVAHLKLYAESR